MATISDLTNNGKTGTIVGAVSCQGLIGRALQFDGVDDYVDIGNQGSSIKSIEFIFKPASIGVLGYLVDLNGTDIITQMLNNIYINNFAGATKVIYVNGVPFQNGVGTNLPVAGVFYHVIVTLSLGFLTSDLDLMRQEGIGFGLGVLDEVRFYTKQLTAAEAANKWNKYANIVSFAETFDYGADGVTKRIPNWTQVSGTWKIGELTAQDGVLKTLGRGDTYLQNVSAGALAIQSTSAYGAWSFYINKGNAANTLDIRFISSDSTSSGVGYLFRFGSDKTMKIFHSSDLVTAVAGGVVNYNISQWYKIDITRTMAGLFSLAVNDIVTGTGTNTTTTASQNLVLDLYAGDRITNIVKRHGVRT